MNDLEIIKMFRNIKPANEKQKRALEAAERAFYNSIHIYIDESVEDFLSGYDKVDLSGRTPKEVYEEYVEYVTDIYDVIVSQSTLTRAIGYVFNLKSVPVFRDGKTIRVFK